MEIAPAKRECEGVVRNFPAVRDQRTNDGVMVEVAGGHDLFEDREYEGIAAGRQQRPALVERASHVRCRASLGQIQGEVTSALISSFSSTFLGAPWSAASIIALPTISVVLT